MKCFHVRDVRVTNCQSYRSATHNASDYGLLSTFSTGGLASAAFFVIALRPIPAMKLRQTVKIRNYDLHF